MSNIISKIPLPFRVTLVVILTIAMVGGGTFFIKYNTDPEYKARVDGTDKFSVDTNVFAAQNRQIEANLTKIAAVNPNDLLYDELVVSDIKIYPSSWTSKYFSGLEMKNSLISDSMSDADNDGLNNQQEYYYGSNPKNKYSFCEILPDKTGPLCQKTDKELVDGNISPLTGLKIAAQRPQKIKKIDRLLAEKNAETAYNNAANEGVDTVQLYQKSMLVNYDNESDKIEFVKGEVSRSVILNFLTVRKKIIEDFTKENNGLDELMFSYITTDPTELKAMLGRYDAIYTQLASVAVPPFAEKVQKYHLYAIDNVRQLLKFRIEETPKLKADPNKQIIIYTDEFKQKSAEISLKISWAYRRLQEEEQTQTEAMTKQFDGVKPEDLK